jgi:hypothetical protein
MVAVDLKWFGIVDSSVPDQLRGWTGDRRPATRLRTDGRRMAFPQFIDTMLKSDGGKPTAQASLAIWDEISTISKNNYSKSTSQCILSKWVRDREAGYSRLKRSLAKTISLQAIRAILFVRWALIDHNCRSIEK